MPPLSTCLEEILGLLYRLVTHINQISTVPMAKWNVVMVIGNGYTFRTCNNIIRASTLPSERPY